MFNYATLAKSGSMFSSGVTLVELKVVSLTYSETPPTLYNANIIATGFLFSKIVCDMPNLFLTALPTQTGFIIVFACFAL